MAARWGCGNNCHQIAHAGSLAMKSSIADYNSSNQGNRRSQRCSADGYDSAAQRWWRSDCHNPGGVQPFVRKLLEQCAGYLGRGLMQRWGAARRTHCQHCMVYPRGHPGRRGHCSVQPSLFGWHKLAIKVAGNDIVKIWIQRRLSSIPSGGSRCGAAYGLG